MAISFYQASVENLQNRKNENLWHKKLGENLKILKKWFKMLKESSN
jgi:hypothetical protein